MLKYTPNIDFYGDDTAIYQVTDKNSHTAQAKVLFHVFPKQSFIHAQDDIVSINQGESTRFSILDNDQTKPDGIIQIVSIIGNQQGDVIIENDQTITYVPHSNFKSSETLTYKIKNQFQDTSQAYITIIVDNDSDGLSNQIEEDLHLNPFDNDTDDDGISDTQDGLEDTDGDGFINANDEDSDNDGILDGTEMGVTKLTAPSGTNQLSPHFLPDADPNTHTDFLKKDTDGDGILDGEEDINHNGQLDPGETDPLSITEQTHQPEKPYPEKPSTSNDVQDSDGDGLLDSEEDINRNGQLDPGETDPFDPDTDGDGLTDKQEKEKGTDPNNWRSGTRISGSGGCQQNNHHYWIIFICLIYINFNKKSKQKSAIK